VWPYSSQMGSVTKENKGKNGRGKTHFHRSILVHQEVQPERKMVNRNSDKVKGEEKRNPIRGGRGMLEVPFLSSRRL